jgi:hypothetical protein
VALLAACAVESASPSSGLIRDIGEGGDELLRTFAPGIIGSTSIANFVVPSE